jgi:hypothetical protein
MLDFVFPVASKKVKAERVCFGFVKAKQFGPQGGPLGGIDKAFKNGVLNTLSIVQAGLGNAGKASLPGFVHGGYVVGDQYKHVTPFGRFEIDYFRFQIPSPLRGISDVIFQISNPFISR